MFARVADIRVQLVPYRGSPQAVADLLGKRLDFMLDPPTAHLEAIKGGQLRALATTGAERFFALPDVPTVAEQGIKDFVIGSWQGVIGPAGLPDDIVKRLNKEIAAVLAEPSVAARLKTLGNDPKASTPEEFRSRVASDIDNWTKVVAAANIERQSWRGVWIVEVVSSVETSAPPATRERSRPRRVRCSSRRMPARPCCAGTRWSTACARPIRFR